MSRIAALPIAILTPLAPLAAATKQVKSLCHKKAQKAQKGTKALFLQNLFARAVSFLRILCLFAAKGL